MKKKNKGRKSITAVSAVVAAGLTPGIISGSPASQPPINDVELTAADAISIGGDIFDFDELFAMEQIRRDTRDIPKVYGPPPSIHKAQRQDSINQSIAEVYGPPPPRYLFVGPEELRSIAANDKQEAADVILEALMDYCRQRPLDPNVTGHIILREDRDLVRDLMMDSKQLEMLQQEIADRFEVQLTEEMLKQLGTLRRVANFIAEVVAPIKEE
ncbi:MAG: acyl carrier protein [Muribaculaceae bacterium]|nr:acyl carrier protein [Muribaculaceae bacterium]